MTNSARNWNYRSQDCENSVNFPVEFECFREVPTGVTSKIFFCHVEKWKICNEK